MIILYCEECPQFVKFTHSNHKGVLRMKRGIRLVSAVVLVMIMCSSAFAALPSVTMLSTKTCPACSQMEKVFSDIKAKYSGKVTTAHIFLEDNPEIAKKYNVRYVPTLIFRDASGKTVAQEVGYRSLKEVLNVFAKKGIKI